MTYFIITVVFSYLLHFSFPCSAFLSSFSPLTHPILWKFITNIVLTVSKEDSRLSNRTDTDFLKSIFVLSRSYIISCNQYVFLLLQLLYIFPNLPANIHMFSFSLFRGFIVLMLGVYFSIFVLMTGLDRRSYGCGRSFCIQFANLYTTCYSGKLSS